MMNNKASNIFAGYDQGHYSLPTDVLKLRDAARRLRTTAQPADPLPGALVDYGAKVRQALLDGGELPPVKALAAAQATSTALATARQVQRDVLDRLGGSLDAALSDSASEIIVGHLRPPFEQIMEKVGDLAAVVGGFPIDDHKAVLGARGDIREAVLVVDEMAEKYASIRACRTALLRLDPPTLDSGRFSEIRNMEQVWPSVGSNHAGAPPWPTDPRRRLLWLVRPDVETWLPTADEQDERWREVYGDKAKQAAEQRRRGALVTP